MKRFLIIVIVFVVAYAGYYFFYPPVVMQRHAQAVMDTLGKTVATKDRAKISEALTALLSPTAKVHLDVSTFSIHTPDGGKPVSQDFDTPTFVTFIDNILFTMTDYDYYPQVETLIPGADGKTVAMHFISKEWSDGPSYYGGVEVGMRFSSDSTCDADITFEGKKILFDKVVCSVQLRSVPRPDEAYKLQQNPQALGEFLR